MGEMTINVNDDSFKSQVLDSAVPVLVDFWAPWCGPCVAIGPILDELAGELGSQVKVAKMNVDENANIPAQYGVRSIPFLVLFKGGQVVDTIAGAVPKARIRTLIDKAL
jgi:thioredoxin 1